MGNDEANLLVRGIGLRHHGCGQFGLRGELGGGGAEKGKEEDGDRLELKTTRRAASETSKCTSSCLHCHCEAAACRARVKWQARAAAVGEQLRGSCFADATVAD
jgi:hypothetical protein